MLSAECAWTVLRAEHARIRDLLDHVDSRLNGDGWTRSPVAEAPRLARLIGQLQAFDEATHRPKGVVLLGLLRGRSPQADQLLEELEQESRLGDQLLSQAAAALQRIGAGDMDAAPMVKSLLAEHRALMLAHLGREDTLLHSQTALLLTPEEWATVASSMSAAMRSVAARKAKQPAPRR